MQVTKWKSLRLLWLPWFLINFYIYVDISFFIESPDTIQTFRSLITSFVLVGCIFYSLGIRCLSRASWQSLLIIGIIDELIGIFQEGWLGVVSLAVISTFYCVLGLYAFHNKTIWRFNQVSEI